MDEMFATGAEVAPTGQDEAVSARKKRVQLMRTELKETINSSPDYTEKLHKLSDSVRVINTLGYGKNGNVILDKAASTSAGKRVLTPTSQIHGYVVENCGSEAIPYTTEVFAKDETGKYVGTKVSKTLAPGERTCLNRKYMTMFCAVPEISFTLENGTMIASSATRSVKNIDDELAAYYFHFNSVDGQTIQVNDDEVKISIDDENGVIKPEYVETFGYLANPKADKMPKAKGRKFTSQDLAANFINTLIQKQGI